MGRIWQHVPLHVLWAVGAKAGEGESATKKQVVRLDLAIAGDSWIGGGEGRLQTAFPTGAEGPNPAGQ